MSWEACAWVWDLDLPSNEKWVLMGLANYCDDNGLAWPRLESLAQKLGLSKPTAIDNLKRLVNRGLVTKKTRKNNSSIYYLVGVKKLNPPEIRGKETLPQGLRNLTSRGKETLPPEVKKLYPILLRNLPLEPTEEKKTPSKKKESVPNLAQEFIVWYSKRYEEVVKQPLVVNWGKDKKLLKPILKAFPLEEAKKIGEKLLNTQDEWLRKRRDIGILCSQWNRLAAEVKADSEPPMKPPWEKLKERQAAAARAAGTKS